MDEKTLKRLQTVISGKKLSIPYEEAKTLALRARAFMKERGKAPSASSTDAWERRMAEGVEALKRHAMKKPK